MATLSQQQDLVDFLKERSLLKILDTRVLAGITKLFKEEQCGPGHIVFRQGQEADAIYIIRQGSVEVIQGEPPKVVSYLTTGDCFGEMALLHDPRRTSTIRVPEEALLLRLPRKAFEELQTYFPEVTQEVTKLINKRQAGKAVFNAPHLQGNLAFFDLPTVIQTVIGSRQNGVLSLKGRAGKLMAQVAVKLGRLSSASFGHLTGEAAICELLTRSEPWDFVFEPQSDTENTAPVDKTLNSKEAHMLLIEGARRADELPRLTRELGWPSTVFQQQAKQPDWSKVKHDNVILARRIWLLLEVSLSVQQLSDKLTYDRYTILSTLEQMFIAELIGPVSTFDAARANIPSYAPVQVAALVHSINEIIANLIVILGEEKVRESMTNALTESSQRYTNLGSIKIRRGTVSLDVRLAAPDVSQSQASAKSLQDLTATFLRLVAESYKP